MKEDRVRKHPKNRMSHQIQFACGATYTADKVECDRHGVKHLMVFAAGTAIEQPKLNGKPMSCLLGCPVAVRGAHG